MVGSVEAAAHRAYLFGSFRLVPSLGVLVEDGRAVRLGSRALDILTVLVTSAGELVSKRQLMEQVWPDTFVVEANLTVHVTALRRALGEGQDGRPYIVNVPGRGYRFVAPVEIRQGDSQPQPVSPSPSRRDNLPNQLTRLIGRSETLEALRHRLGAQRLLTVVGPAGIGKTSVALALAERLTEQFEDGVWFVDLAAIGDGALLVSALVSVLRPYIQSDATLPALVAALAGRRMLVVLDNCEHVVDAAAEVAVALLRGCRGVTLLATSREALRIQGEQAFRLDALESPAQSDEISAAEALRYPAVALFVDRVAATLNDFELNDDDAAAAARICRELDGIPLAIEFASARVDIFGVGGVAARLDDRLRFLAGGRRAGQSRHRSMSAALDWSHDLLTSAEQLLFRRLAVFAGGFKLEAAVAIAAPFGEAEVADLLASLVLKSLVAADLGEREVRFRLLETARVFAADKLAQSDDGPQARRHHAISFRDALRAAQAVPQADMAAAFSQDVDNVRAALAWALSPHGDRGLAIELALASVPLWFQTSLLTECHDWMSQATGALGPDELGTYIEMEVRIALSTSLVFTKGLTEATHRSWEAAAELADRLQNPAYTFLTLRALWTCELRVPRLDRCIALARRQCDSASQIGDPVETTTGYWMMALAANHRGDLALSRDSFEIFLGMETEAERWTFLDQTAFDRRSSSYAILANTVWGLGFPDTAVAYCRRALAEAREVALALPLCEALFWGGWTLWLASGDIAQTEPWADELVALASEHTHDAQKGLGLALKGVCLAAKGDLKAAERLIASGLAKLKQSRYGPFDPLLTAELAAVMAADGRPDEGLAFIAAFEAESENPQIWCGPELRRRKGELQVLKGDIGAAEASLKAAIAEAQRMGSLTLELRAATSLASLRGRDHGAHPSSELAMAYARFDEGFDLPDLKRARRWLEPAQPAQTAEAPA